jgi:hypothetical protein
MKVQDLKKLLNQYADDTPVVVSGYEGGYNDLSILQVVQITRDVYTADYMGQHEDTDTNAKNVEQALLLGGRNNLARVENA